MKEARISANPGMTRKGYRSGRITARKSHTSKTETINVIVYEINQENSK